jgi:PAS domain S-box-containing protein
MYKNLRLLIIEDEPDQLAILKRLIKQIGHEIISNTEFGQTGYQQIISLNPDLILLNANLQGELKGLKLIRKLSATVSTPIILLTSSMEEITLKEVKKIGFFGIVQKPLTEWDLKTEIDFTYERFQKSQELKRENLDSKRYLKETEQFFQQVVNNVSDIIYRIDLSGVFTYVNPSALKSTGYDRDYLYKTKYTDIIRPDFKRKALTFFQRLIKKEVSDAYLEVPIHLKNGREIWLGQNIHLLRVNGRILGLQVVARDITEEIQFKEELIKARNLAEHTAELKSQFLANMSHEIRTPLNGIIGIIKLLERTPLNEKQHSYLRAVSASSDQLMGIINDILDLSKIESGKMELNKVEFNFNELVRSLIDVMEIKAGMKGLKLSYKIDDELPEMLIGDPVSLNQILYNLIGNSLKFTQEGEISLKVKLRTDCNNDNCTHIEMIVSDTGVGMKKDVQDKIFEAFTQAESSTTRQYGGTGLGLTIVKKLIDLQNGVIFVESEEGKGSQFYVHLCFDKYIAAKSEKFRQDSVDHSILFEKQILVVEDNFVNQLVTKDLLEDLGSIVTIAENGLVALQKLELNSFDVVLMDMQMPVMDGFETMSRIRSNPRISHIPILALSANVIKSEIEKCLKSGATDYLSKPFMPEDLIVRISNLILRNSLIHSMSSINMKVLASYTNGKEILMLSTLQEIKKVLNSEISEISQLLTKEDYKSLRSRMHKLKPNFRMIGLVNLYDLTREAEKSEDPETMNKHIVQLLKVLPKLIEDLSNECAILEDKLTVKNEPYQMKNML